MSSKENLQQNPILFPKALFWDVEYSADLFTNYPEFVVDRILNYGSMGDFGKLLSFYGKDKIKACIKRYNSNYSPKTKSFLKVSFGISDQDLCSRKQSQDDVWN